MKFLMLALSFLAVLHCSLSDDNNKNYRNHDGQAVAEKSYPMVDHPPPDFEVPPRGLPPPPPAPRPRRSPPRFDPNKMKGKIVELLRKKRDMDIGKIFRRVQDRIGRK